MKIVIFIKKGHVPLIEIENLCTFEQVWQLEERGVCMRDYEAQMGRH